MKQLYNYISEAAKPTSAWIAVEVVTAADMYHKKDTVSQRVVSVDTYHDLKNGKTKGYMQVKSVTALGPECKSKEQAMDYLDVKEKTKRKSKIKTDAGYVIWCISSGKFTASGKTNWDWNIWDNADKDEETEISNSEIYYGNGAILFGAKGSLNEGDTVCCIDNDSEKKLTGAPRKIELVCDCSLDAFREAFRKKYPNMCKRPSFQFGKRSDGLPWSKMGQMYSIKGIIETEKYNNQ